MATKRSKQIQPATGVEKAFGLALREVRKSKAISQEQLSLMADFDRTYISLIERGIQSPTVRTVVRLAHILETRPSTIVRRMELLLDQEPPQPEKPARRGRK